MALNIASTLARFSGLKILVIGDIMLDHYLMGDATRISPEAPVPVVSVASDRHVPGGAANVANNLAGLGISPTLLGSYGDDRESAILRELLDDKQIKLSILGRIADIPTILKTRVVVQRQQLCRIDRERKPADYALDHLLASAECGELLAAADAILLSDYAKGVINDNLLQQIRSAFADQAKPPLLVLDPKPKRQLDLQGLGLMTPNRSEALQMAGFDSSPNAEFDATAVCDAIFEKYAPQKLVVTLGADGMLLGEAGRITGRISTEAREVFDVSGAGDTVVAVLTAALAAGESLEDAAALANKAAGIVVGHLGTSPINAAELIGTESG